MIKPPITRVKHSKSELDQLYVQYNFDELEANCKPIVLVDEQFIEDNVTFPGTIRRRGLKYRPHGATAAVVFHYTQLDGTVVRSIRMLCIDGIHHVPFD